MIARDFDTHFSLDLLHKDLKLFLDTAGPLRVPAPGVAAMLEAVQQARAQGFGAEDIAAVVKVFEPAPTRPA
jgi:3-hydroxyisobutyrate dehydrogenase-like beta-hydroxyacid dehydrogenase